MGWIDEDGCSTFSLDNLPPVAEKRWKEMLAKRDKEFKEILDEQHYAEDVARARVMRYCI
tara:strand:+ start:584 stop:763 length:180 start_codon:yes stop_codon:yes gene_type:complete